MTCRHDEHRPLIDPATLACLGTGWHAAAAIGPDGESSLWLLHPDGDDRRTSIPVPAHEQIGPLPWAVRVAIRTYRCGRPTTAGSPCRTPVTRAGATCHHHGERVSGR